MIPPPASTGDGIPRLDMKSFLEQHIESRKRILARLNTQIEDISESKEGEGRSEWTAWLIRRHYPDRLPLEEDGQIHTRHVLISALHDLAEPGEVDESANEIVRKLRQKYEVFGRVADRYSPEIRKVGEEWAGQEVCGLLAYILLCQFSQGNDYRNLNATLKIGDSLDGSQPDAEAITFAVLHKELDILGKAFEQT